MTRKMIRTTTVHTTFSLNETSLSGVLTSGMILTKGDNALRNVDGKDLFSPAGIFEVPTELCL